MNGILPINKPQGFTSFDVIAKMRGILKMKRLGHSGTLDPMATGVLLVFVGKATKACDILPNNEKSYTAGFVLGKNTDTQDITGSIISEKSPDSFEMDESDIENVLPLFKGNIKQIPPMYSAVSVNGKRLYDLARQGIEVERKERDIYIDDIKLLSFDKNTKEGTLFVSCEKGTYIRTILFDIGEKLGVGGCMTSLVRNSSSGITLENCLSLEEVQSLSDKNEIASKVIPVDEIFVSYPKITFTQKQTSMYKNGIKLDINRIEADFSNENEKYRLYSNDNEFLGIGIVNFENFELKSYKNFY